MQGRTGRLTVIVVGVSVTLVLLPVAINVATGGTLPSFLAPVRGWVWPLIGVLWLGATALAIQEFRHGGAGAVARLPEHPRNRRHALDRVTRLVTQRLDNSLGEQVRIALALDEQPDAVIRFSSVRVQPVDGDPHDLSGPPEAAFRLLDESMLILGAPGAGKTTMLLEIVRALVAAAREDEAQPIPVLVDLAGWSRSATRRGTREDKGPRDFTKWMLGEINRQYAIPARVAAAWLTDGRLALLFDGLDEVAEVDRDNCVRELNALQDRYLVPQIAVSSRERDYAAITRRLHLSGAVTIRPLTRTQLLPFLHLSYLHGVRAALMSDRKLWELVSSPLMLNVMILAFHGRRAHEIFGERDPRARRRQLFEAYVTEVLARRSAPKARYRTTDVRRWLWYLASVVPGAIVPKGLVRPYERRPEWTVPESIAAGVSRLFFPAAAAGIAGAAELMISLRFGVVTGFLLLGWGIVLVPLVGSFARVGRGGERPAPLPAVWVAVGAVFGAALGFGAVLLGEQVAEWVLLLPAPWPRVVFIVVTSVLAASAHANGIEHEWTVGALNTGLVVAVLTTVLTWLLGLSAAAAAAAVSGWGVGLMLGVALVVLAHLANTARYQTRQHGVDSSWRPYGLRFIGSVVVAGGCAGVVAALVSGAPAGDDAWPVVSGLVAGLLVQRAAQYSTTSYRLLHRPVLVAERLTLTLLGYLPVRTRRFLRYASDRSLLVHAGGEFRFVHAMVHEHLAIAEPTTATA